MPEDKIKSIGGIWKKQKNGGNYLSGQIEIDGVKHNFVAFHNSFKKADNNQPDYYIPAPKPREEQQGQTGSYEEMPQQDNESDDLPF